MNKALLGPDLASFEIKKRFQRFSTTSLLIIIIIIIIIACRVVLKQETNSKPHFLA